jgi:hypothetical protein
VLPEKTLNNKMIKKHYFFLAIFYFFCLSGIAQAGFLGKRVHFQFEEKFTPAWSNLNFNHKQGVFRFNYNLMPSVEYIFSDKWSVSAHYQYSPSAFKINKLADDAYNAFTSYHGYYGEGYFMENGNRYQGYTTGGMTIHGCGINISRYFKDCAPAGYYVKFGVEALFYKISVPYSGYDTIVPLEPPQSIYDREFAYINMPGVFAAHDWALGLRLELGRNFFIGRYVSLGTSLSCGLLCKGWANLIYNGSPKFIDEATKRLFTSYIGGISIKIGILPF